MARKYTKRRNSESTEIIISVNANELRRLFFLLNTLQRIRLRLPDITGLQRKEVQSLNQWIRLTNIISPDTDYEV